MPSRRSTTILFPLLCLSLLFSIAAQGQSTSTDGVLYPTGTYDATGSSVSIVDTNYTPPSGAKYVATSGSDTSGNGSLSNPWRTIAKAIASTPTGGTIVIRGGSYHESVQI